MEKQTITIGQLRRNLESTFFQTRYHNLITGKQSSISNNGIIHLLKLAIIFLNYGDTSIQRLGYRIILRYSILFEDFKPLYDVAINKGFIPISKLIENRHVAASFSDGFFKSYFSSYQDNFLQEGIYLSYGQKKLIKFSDANNGNFALVAPTSYGKSEIIINKVIQNLDKKICIIVPSKALLAQTKRRLFGSSSAGDIGRIITHSEMYRGDEKRFVSVLTQERLLRLLQKNPDLSLDLLLIDEAHNLLKKDDRSILLAQVILIIKKRNKNTVLNFFSPFISEAKNLKIPYGDYLLDGEYTKESLKVERYYNCDLITDKKLNFYDQFINTFSHFNGEYYNSIIDLINEKKATKNIVYLNKQRDVVDFSLKLAANNSTLQQSIGDIDILTKAISDFLHPDYNLLRCIKSGIAYHHGGMPEIVRLYVESIFSENKNLHFIVTTSTLLEGINIPAEKIFLLTTKIGRNIFSRSEFKNLIGRICRFSEVFHKENGRLEMLEPEIYLIKGQYENQKANHTAFLQDKAKSDLILNDKVDNILLKDKSTLNDKEKLEVRSTLEYLENIEPNTVSIESPTYVESLIAKLCYKNNVYDFDIKLSEKQLIANLARVVNNEKIETTNILLETIYKIFFVEIDISNDNIKRLENDAARRFYSMILEWRSSSTSFKEMIGKFVGYWNSLNDPIIYFGRAWGDVKMQESDHYPQYINLSSKSNADRVNLAILKIKEEQDFVEFNLLKYIEIIFELDLIDHVFYEKIKYGSSDPRVISLLKNGFSIELSKVLVDKKYRDLITFNFTSDDILINEFIISQMRANGENEILIFETMHHIRFTGNLKH